MKIIVMLCVVALTGCGATKLTVASFDGRSGVIVPSGGGINNRQLALIEANSQCFKAQGGYGVDKFFANKEEGYSFSCFVKEREENLAREKANAVSELSGASSADINSSKKMCEKFGFKLDVPEFSNCVLQLEMSKKKSAEDEERYRTEQEAYDRKITEAEEQNEREKRIRMLGLGVRLLSGQGLNNSSDVPSFSGSVAPVRPTPIHQTIRLPNGRSINCTTMGRNTDCF